MLKAMLMFALALASTSHAIVTRHDRDEALYRNLAKDCPMVCRVGPGMGTLIDSLWVITAAHVAEAASSSAPTARFGEREIAVSRIEIHPDFAVEGKHRDIALLRLAEPVTDIAFAHLYRDNDELGRSITFVGDGWSGDGRSGSIEGERIMRAAHNTVDSVHAGWLVFTFDAPPAGDDLEGISGPGDSGGPALFRRGDSLFVIGVSAYNVGDIECVYGTLEYYCRVSDELEWIDGVVSGKIDSGNKPRLMRYGENESGRQTVSREEIVEIEIPVSDDARYVETLKKLVASIESKSVDDYIGLFCAHYLDKRRQQNDPVEGMHQFMVNVYKGRGSIAGFHQLSGKGLQLSDSDYPMRPITFHLSDGTSGYFGIAIDDSGKIEHLSVFVKDGICPNGKNCQELYSLDDLVRATK